MNRMNKTMFTVLICTVTLFTLGMGTAAAATTVAVAPATVTSDTCETVAIVINTDETAGIGSVTMDLDYDPAKVTYNGKVADGDLGAVTVNQLDENTLRMVAATGSNPGPTGTVTVVELEFCPAGNPGDCSDLTLTVTEITDGNVAVIVPDSVANGRFCTPNGGATTTTVAVAPATVTSDTCETVAIVINTDETAGIGSVTMDLDYDPAKVTYNGKVADGDLGAVTVNQLDENTLRMVAATGSNPGPTGTVTVVELEFCPAGNPGDCSDLTLTVTEITDGSVAVIVPDSVANGQFCIGSSNTYYRDADGDSYGDPNDSVVAESAPSGYVSDNTDCDDTNAAVNPGATEIWNDGIDNDCDGYTDCDDSDCLVDADGDGYNAVPCGDDCDDTNAAVNPGATEVQNGIDDNCNGQIDEGFCECDFCMPLEAGLNLVSVPRCVEVGGSSMALAVFNLSGIETCDSWDGCTGEWSDDLPNAMQVVPARAYFVYKVNAETICMNGTTYMDTQTLCIDTWAMVGFPSLDPMTVTEFRAASNLNDKFLTAWQWNGGWYPMTGNSNMEPYHGYVLWMTDNGVMPGMIAE